MNEYHVIVEEKAVDANKAKHEEESEISPNHTWLNRAFLDHVEPEETEPVATLVLAQANVDDEHDERVKDSPHTDPADDFIKDPWKTVAAPFRNERNHEETREDHSIGQNACCHRHKFLKEIERRINHINLQNTGSELRNRYTNNQADNILPTIVNYHPEEEQKEYVKQSQLKFHWVSFAPSNISHYFIIDIFHLFKC